MQIWGKSVRAAVVAAGLLVTIAPWARADEWNERTVLKFSAPVMVPGATLPAGEYDFQLANSTIDHNVVRIFTHGDHKLIATAQAVPMKRLNPATDVIVTFAPTEAGAPVAMKGWFYPGSAYGHQFVYPDEQARAIASRTRALVLSEDTRKGDAQAGRIHVIDAEGRSADWHADAATMNEWQAWLRAHPNAEANAAGRVTPGKNDIAVVRTERTGMTVKIDDLEDNPQKYVGQRVSVDAEVEKVVGPRLFTIDEPSWADLDGEVMVTMPTQLAALVKEGDRVTVEGTVRPFNVGSVEHEWGWTDHPRDVEVKLAKRPVIVADRVIGGNNDRSLIIDVEAPKPTGTSGSASSNTNGNGPSQNALTSLDQVVTGGSNMVGRRVQIDNLRIAKSAENGFVASNGQYRVFVLPSLPSKAPTSSGNSVSVDGVVLAMPHQMADRLSDPTADREVYVYAWGVTQ